MAVCTFRFRKFTTVAAGDLTQAHRGFKTTSVNQNNHPCVMRIKFDHETSRVVIDVEEWDQDQICMADHRRWTFTPSFIESAYWGVNSNGGLNEEPYVTIYPSEFSIAYSTAADVATLTADLIKMDCRPALERYAHLNYPAPQSNSVVQIEFDEEHHIVVNVYPLRNPAEVELAARTDRRETSETWFKSLLNKGRALA